MRQCNAKNIGCRLEIKSLQLFKVHKEWEHIIFKTVRQETLK